MKTQYLAILVVSLMLNFGCAGGKGRQNGSQTPTASGSTAPRTGDSVTAETPDEGAPSAGPDADTETPDTAAPSTGTDGGGSRGDGTGGSGAVADSDGDGVADSADRCPSTRRGDRVDPDGCTSLEIAGGEHGRDCPREILGYVSNRTGFQNVYVQSTTEADAISLTNNRTRFRSYGNLGAMSITTPSSTTFPMLHYTESLLGGLRTFLQISPVRPLALPEEAGWTNYGFSRKADGSKAAYFRSRPEGRLTTTEIRIAPFTFPMAAGAAVTLGGPSTSEVMTFGKMTWWNNRLIFDAADGVTSRLYSIDTTAASPTITTLQIPAGAYFREVIGSEPAMSPDGTKLAFVDNNHGYVSISVCRLEENPAGYVLCLDKHMVAYFHPGTATSPAWSLDSRMIYYVVSDSHGKDIYKVNVDDSSTAVRVTSDSHDETSPVVIPPPSTCVID